MGIPDQLMESALPQIWNVLEVPNDRKLLGILEFNKTTLIDALRRNLEFW